MVAQSAAETGVRHPTMITLRALCVVSLISITVWSPVCSPALALTNKTLQSVVSVLPVWPGRPQGGFQRHKGQNGKPVAPEGSGVVLFKNGYIATAWHVVRPARRIDVRLSDGRILPAKLLGHDAASDIALLKVEADLPPISIAGSTKLAQRVCAVSNAYGLGLSVTCGVISALSVANAGFNAVEDFVQTDAAANPGSSGGALVDSNGQLVGMVSAIFAAKTDTNIGVNFAISSRLLMRVINELKDRGRVDYVAADWRLASLSRADRARMTGARVVGLVAGGVAANAGIEHGDIVTRIADRRILSPRDAVAELALVSVPRAVDIEVFRAGKSRTITLKFEREPPPAVKKTPDVAQRDADCPYPAAVCKVRQAVFPIESFDPLASAVRIAPDLLVTNRHAVANRTEATVQTPTGALKARVVATAYRGDLALLQVDGLPDDGLILPAITNNGPRDFADGPYFAVGADVSRKQIRVFKPGRLLNPPAPKAALARLHVTAQMQPGVSGGALVDQSGRLVAIAVGGGEGRNEALPVKQVRALLKSREARDAAAVHDRLGRAFEACAAVLDNVKRAPRGRRPDAATIDILKHDCRASGNPVQHLTAGRYLARARAYDDAIAIITAAVDQVPNSINARISLLVGLQLAGRFKEMLPHARWLMTVVPTDPQALRFGIQTGVWGGDKQLAEQAYQRLLSVDPRQARAARRFIDRAPPAPRRR